MDISTSTITHYRFKDLTGLRFGKLVAVRPVGRSSRDGYYWECVCDCGGKKIALAMKLRSKTSPVKSCGCIPIGAKQKHGHAIKGSRAPEYTIWANMIRRCTDPNDSSYRRYGERGINVHPLYLDYRNFIKDIGPRPTPKHSVDRINNDGNYEPGNIRWATRNEQARNRSDTRFVTFNGETRPAVEWAEVLNINKHTLLVRLYSLGWSVEDALTKPIRTRSVTGPS